MSTQPNPSPRRRAISSPVTKPRRLTRKQRALAWQECGPRALSIDGLRLRNRSIAPGVRELVLSVEIGGRQFDIATAMQGSPCIDDWIGADGIRELIEEGCPFQVLPE